jgi:uncharacterized protein (DUF362 family)
MSTISIIYGTDITEMTRTLLEKSDVMKRLTAGLNVVIKPNLVVAKPAAEGAVTHPEIIEGIILFLKENKITSITIAEGSWLGETTTRAFDRCGYSALAKKYGIKLFDTKNDKVVKKTADGLSLGVCETVLNADFLINVPVLKGHCQTTMTCCLKNMKGCIPDSEKRRYHNIGLHKPIAALNMILKPQLHIIDCICGDPTFEEGGNPVRSDRILLGTDPVLLDSYGAALLGYDPLEIEYLQRAARLGIGKCFNADTKIDKWQTEKRPTINTANQSHLVRRFAKSIDEQNACSACYAALICALRQHPSPHFYDCGSDGRTIKIGQSFRNQKIAGFGVGNCCSGCDRYVPGCPPTASQILSMFRSEPPS